jgi:hypothetical protein
LISLLGLLSVGVVLIAFANPRIRNVERDLPDHVAASPDVPAASPGVIEPAD